MIRRHFFLAAAVIVLAIMIVVGGIKVLGLGGNDQGPGGPGGPGGAAGAGAPQGKRGPGGRAGFGATQVSVSVVQPRTFNETIEVLGVAKGRQSITLTAAATQLVDRVRFTDGQRVAKGAVLVELRALEQDAGIVQAQARVVQAQRAYDRYRKLGQQGWASQAAVDEFEASYRTAQADLSAARAREADRVIRAPFAGVVGLSDIAPGALVNPGAPIVTLDDISTIRVDFQVPERYLAQLRNGQTILANVDAYPGETITGRIAQLDSRIDTRTRAITARAEFPNPGGRLKPGMLIRVGVSQGVRQSLSAPEAAVSVQADNAFVYVIRQVGQRTVAEQRPVVTGIRQQGMVEIRDGVRAGERIVADGLNKIQPNQPIRVGAPQGAAPQGAAPAGQGGQRVRTPA